MKHAVTVLNVEKRKLINRLYEMQEEHDLGKKEHKDEAFQVIKRKIAQVGEGIKVLEDTLLKGRQLKEYKK